MSHRSVLLSMSVFLSVAANVTAGDHDLKNLFSIKAWRQNCVGCFTCDDYVRKCEPCGNPVRCFTCDDYCRPCLPWAKPTCCFQCDDYCRKPFSWCCPPMFRSTHWKSRAGTLMCDEASGHEITGDASSGPYEAASFR
jgi:hypothetical protein